MAEPAQAVEVDVEARLDQLFSPKEEAPTQEKPEAEQDEAQAETVGDEVEAPAETSEAEAEVIEVEFNGSKYQVPPELKDVLMKSSDYTQKTQALAQQRRDIELQAQQFAMQAQAQAFEQSVAQEVETLRMLEQYIPYMKANTNWDSLTTDQFVRKQKELSDLADQHRELSKAIEAKRNEFGQKLDGERKKIRTQTAEVLSKAIPGWNDKAQSEVEAYVKTLGYPEVAIPHMTSLDYQVAWKAAQYDKLKTQTASAVKKAAEAPVIKATARREMPSQVKEMLNVKKALKTAKPGSDAQKAAIDQRLSQLFR